MSVLGIQDAHTHTSENHTHTHTQVRTSGKTLGLRKNTENQTSAFLITRPQVDKHLLANALGDTDDTKARNPATTELYYILSVLE